MLPSAAGTTTYFAVDDCGAGVDQAAASLAIFLKSLIQSCPRREYPDVVVGEAELEAIAVERDLVNPTRPGRKKRDRQKFRAPAREDAGRQKGKRLRNGWAWRGLDRMSRPQTRHFAAVGPQLLPRVGAFFAAASFLGLI